MLTTWFPSFFNILSSRQVTKLNTLMEMTGVKFFWRFFWFWEGLAGCKLYLIQTTRSNRIGNVWNIRRRMWHAKKVAICECGIFSLKPTGSKKFSSSQRTEIFQCDNFDWWLNFLWKLCCDVALLGCKIQWRCLRDH